MPSPEGPAPTSPPAGLDGPALALYEALRDEHQWLDPEQAAGLAYFAARVLAPGDDLAEYDPSGLTDEELAQANRLHDVIHRAGGLYEPYRNPSGCDRFWCLRTVPGLGVVEQKIRADEAGRVREQVAEEIARAIEVAKGDRCPECDGKPASTKWTRGNQKHGRCGAGHTWTLRGKDWKNPAEIARQHARTEEDPDAR